MTRIIDNVLAWITFAVLVLMVLTIFGYTVYASFIAVFG